MYLIGNLWADPNHYDAVNNMKNAASNACKETDSRSMAKLSDSAFGSNALVSQFKHILVESRRIMLLKIVNEDQSKNS